MDVRQLLEYAKQFIENPDLIVDPYDLTYVWVSKKFCNISGYSSSELVGEQLLKFEDYKNVEPWRIESKMVTPNKKIRINSLLLVKNGPNVKINGYGRSFEFDNQPYMAGKILEVK